eukprot:c24309_g2_i1 orf=815-4747(+)
MFYSQFILAKKGPLGTIWIAAHLERKLRKNQVAETDIGVTVDNILFPEVPIALRLSGHLLLGVVRIYSRQVNYLFNDCSETLGKIKQAFHAAAVDLPPEATTAPFHSITLPETFDFDELELAPDSESSFLHLNGNYVDHHVTTKEQITLQDCIENNPYLGSSQFGLDERFGDGDGYSFLGLDFDEEFLAEKPRSPSGASTSKPLLKEETIVPQVGCENEVTHMDIDHPCEPVESEQQKVSANGGVVNNVFELGQIEGDNQLNAVGPTNFLDPLNESAGLKAPPSNDSDFTLSQPDTPGFHAYTPRNLEACTPDLNQEYCPPDEPSTPALVDETSSPMYQENVIESAGRFSPVMLVNPERNSPFEPLPGSLMPPQVSVVTPGSSSIQGNRSPSPASFQGFPLQQQQQQQSPSPPSFQGFLLQQAAPAEVSREAFVTKAENSQVLSVKGNAAGVSPSFESFPQPSSLQQIRTAVSHEGVVFPAGASSSLLTSSEASLAASHQQIGNPSAFVNNQWAGTVHQEVSPHFQNQGLAVSPQQSSFGSLVDSPALQPLRTMQNTVASQVLMSPPVSQTSVIPSFSASSGSVLPMETGLLSGHSVNMDWHKEAAHDLAVTKGLVWQSAAQQHTASSSAAMPSISSSIVMGECETLRSAFDMQRGTPDFLLLQKDMSDERIPGLESDRNKPFSVGSHGVTKEAILPVFDKTPVLREETPFMATTASYLSTQTIDSLPGDDDVLASILGRKSKAFKVVSTPKLPKAPKANVAAKRPRKAPRVTPKKRKIDFDTVAVLHGDVIRQQLANAEDIRRERRKAPCTRREVWSFIRESEGQENFDEPTLPELSSDLHDLYHDVLHGPESRPPASALDGAAKAKETLESEVVRSGERDCVVDCVNVDTNKLDTRGESDPLVDFANNDSSKDVCINVYAGSVENNSMENNAEQLKVDMKGETAQANPCEGSAGSEVVENISAEKLFKPEEDSEGLAGKERDTTSLPESHGSENHITNSIISRETGANEQAVQETKLDKQIEGARHAPGDIMVSSFAEKTVGVVAADVGNEGTAMALQQHTESLEEKKQPSSGLDGENFYEGEVAMLSKDADLKALDVPSDGMDATEVPVSEATGGKDATEVPVSEATDGKDATEVPVSEAAEVPVSEAADMDKGNVEDSEKIPTSNPSEEEANLCRVDEEMAGMEFERDTDFLDDDDNDVGYAEIDYSSDEQDVSIQDSGGWSARSRNVGRYLKTVFEEMEGGSKRIEQGATLGLERLLARKTKREAARMFFETLVLKTKDYIHVEQKVAYQDIHLFPRSKLMKTEF